MTTEVIDDESKAGPSSSQPVPPSTPKLSLHFEKKLFSILIRKIAMRPPERQKYLTIFSTCNCIWILADKNVSAVWSAANLLKKSSKVQKTGVWKDLNPEAYITSIRREAYSNGLNAESLLFLAPAVSQAAACDGTKITTTSSIKLKL